LRLYLDCEWTRHDKPELLSLGLVGDDVELYLEVDDPRLHARASDFVHDLVLPQFGTFAGARRADSLRAAGVILADFLQTLRHDSVICFDVPTDGELAMAALRAAKRLEGLARRVQWRLVADEVASVSDDQWDEAFDRRERESGLFRHHALLDSRVFKDVLTTGRVAH